MLYIDEFRVLPKTVLSVFEQVRLYKHYGLDNHFCLASNRPFRKNNERRNHFTDNFSPQEQKGISENHAEYFGDHKYIKKVPDHLPINQDFKPVSEYYLGLKVKERLLSKDRQNIPIK